MAVAATALDSQRIFVASQWQLMWWRFRKHKVAVASAVVVVGFYLAVLGADFLAYSDPNASEAQRSLWWQSCRPLRCRSGTISCALRT